MLAEAARTFIPVEKACEREGVEPFRNALIVLLGVVIAGIEIPRLFSEGIDAGARTQYNGVTGV
jgi:hypothetical protein